MMIPWWTPYAGPLVAIISIVVSLWNITIALLLWPIVMVGHSFILKRNPSTIPPNKNR